MIEELVNEIKALRSQPIIIKVDAYQVALKRKSVGLKEFEVGKYYDFDFNETNKEYNSFEFLDYSRIDGFPIFRTKLTNNVYLPDIFGTDNIQLVTPLEDNVAAITDPNWKSNPLATTESREKQKDKFNKVTTK